MNRHLLLATVLAVPALVAANEPAGKPRYGSWGVVLEDMDKTVKPGDDFYNYAEGSWLKHYSIPDDRINGGYNYQMPVETEDEVHAIIEDMVKHPTTAQSRQVGDFYSAWMDEAGIEARGLAPLKPWLARIDAVTTRSQLVRLMMQPGYASPVAIGISFDRDDPTRYLANVRQMALGLPTRDYYLLEGEKYDGIRKAYRNYMIRLQTLAGLTDPAGRTDRIMALETRLSEDQWTPEADRDSTRNHNPMTREKLAVLAPEFDWTQTLASVGLARAQTVDVHEPTAITAAGKLLAEVPLTTWKEYLAFRFVSDHAESLPHVLDDAHFDFYSRTLDDVTKPSARWRRGVKMIDGNLGEAVGEIYVQRHWPAKTARLVGELVGDMRTAYAQKIEGAAWMDEATRKAALAKLAVFDVRVGHPVKWTDYSTLEVSRTDPLSNSVASDDFRWRLKLARFPGPVDRTVWGLTPQTVDAYFEATLNQITVPAAELQPPFFDPWADPAVNYAETGATTIGHELGHGFDDQGRQYDEKGRLRDWWTGATAAKYTLKADRLAAQFDAYEPIPGVHIKGRLTLGENLADLGGLETAFAAYRRYVSRHGEPTVIDGLTGEQRFFLAFAQAWQGKWREGAERAQLLSNPHSPERYRVDGIVRNFDPWYAAFNVKPGDKLYLPPEQRVHIWTK